MPARSTRQLRGYTYSATTPEGAIVDRYSAAHNVPLYTYVVVGCGTPSFCGRLDLAEAERARRQKMLDRTAAKHGGIGARAVVVLPVTATMGNTRVARAR